MSTLSYSRQRKPLRALSDLTFVDLERQPDRLIGPADLASSGISGSYASISRAVRAGKLPQPIRMPSGRLAWRVRDVLSALGVNPRGVA